MEVSIAIRITRDNKLHIIVQKEGEEGVYEGLIHIINNKEVQKIINKFLERYIHLHVNRNSTILWKNVEYTREEILDILK